MKDIKYSVKFLCETNLNNWECYKWLTTVNGESFEYHTGLGHATKVYKDHYRRNKKPLNSIRVGNEFLHVPRLEDVLESLILDLECGEYSFNEFCDNLGYDNDSLKALDIYRACMGNGEKFLKAVGRVKVNEIRESLNEL